MMKYFVITLLLGVSFFSDQALAQSQKTIFEYLSTDRQFTTLADHLKTQGLENKLGQEGDLMIFAPTNRGFNALPNLFRKALFAEDTLLKEILLVHIIEQNFDLESGVKLASAQGALIAVDEFQNHLSFAEGRIEAAPIKLSNGTIYIIDWVIFPSEIRDRLPSIVGRPDNY